MNLIVFPGGGNPDISSKYKKVYSLVEEIAKQYSYNKIFTDIRWPGHISTKNATNERSFNLDEAAKVAKARIALMPKEPYVVLARSFGCFVALKMIADTKRPDPNLIKVILWGPVPLWGQWEMWNKNLTANQKLAREKGCKVTEKYYQSLEPIEYLVQIVTVPTIIVSGSEDSLCKPEFVEYLKKLSGNNRQVNVKNVVPGAEHEVTEDNSPEIVDLYAKALFA